MREDRNSSAFTRGEAVLTQGGRMERISLCFAWLKSSFDLSLFINSSSKYYLKPFVEGFFLR